MSFSDFIVEYLAAGLLSIAILILAVADPTGLLQVVVTELPTLLRNHGVPADLDFLKPALATLLFLIVALASYPAGYLLLGFGFRILRVFGRKRIYVDQTSSALKEDMSLANHLSHIKTVAGSGFAQGKDYEEPFALIRLYLFINHRELFSALTSYWTRQSRMFAVFTGAFCFCAACAAVALGLSECTKHQSAAFISAFAWLAIAAFFLASTLLSICAYRVALRVEICNFVRVARAQHAVTKLQAP
jgi:hypothetical protein